MESRIQTSKPDFNKSEEGCLCVEDDSNEMHQPNRRFSTSSGLTKWDGGGGKGNTRYAESIPTRLGDSCDTF